MAGEKENKTVDARLDRKVDIKFFYLQVKIGHQKEFENSLSRLRGKDADISKEAAEIMVDSPIPMLSLIISKLQYF